MTDWTDATVSAALETEATAPEVSYTGIGTDTRSLSAGELFVALRGERHDGHDHLGEAAAAGARGAVVDRQPAEAPASLRYYRVADTLRALGRLARYRRRRMGFRVCAVTGTNGKTTTKDLLSVVLGTRFRVHATSGNLNNLIGAPLTLLSAPADTDLAIVEMGTNAPGEIARLAAMAEPDMAVITGVAAGHLEGLRDVAGVLSEKTSLLAWLPPGGFAAVRDTPEELVQRARELASDVVVAGTTEEADPAYRASDVQVGDDGAASFSWEGRRIRLALRGKHNVGNAMLAFAVGMRCGVEAEPAIEAAAALQPSSMRSEIRRCGALTVIVDCYNANPASVAAAVDLLSDMPRRGGRVAFLGTMLELGDASRSLHEESARAIARADVDTIVATGGFARAFAGISPRPGQRLICEEDIAAAFERWAEEMGGDEVVLLKASRGVALERLLPRFEERWGVLHPHGEANWPRERRSDTGLREEAHSEEHTPTGMARNGMRRPGATPGTEG